MAVPGGTLMGPCLSGGRVHLSSWKNVHASVGNLVFQTMLNLWRHWIPLSVQGDL